MTAWIVTIQFAGVEYRLGAVASDGQSRVLKLEEAAARQIASELENAYGDPWRAQPDDTDA
ncbi:MAG: hypothetical protein OXI22_08050 [Defluviicoccus sp.]|nr:hypothetical protein [Defluviicoccus sp.]